jgi:hypothetical protein
MGGHRSKRLTITLRPPTQTRRSVECEVTARRDDRGDWYVVFDYVLLSGGSISWMYDEPSPGDSAPGKDREPDTAAN